MGGYARLLLAVHILLLCLRAGVLGQEADVAPAPAVRRPDCETRCGDFEVPYPFGIGKRCAINDRFRINCTVDARGVKRPFVGSMEVTKVSMRDNKAWVKLGISSRCYDRAAGRNLTQRINSQNFTDSAFRFSRADNKIFVIGCNTFSYMLSHAFVVGCVSRCGLGGKGPINGTCSGNGCCEVDVPHDMHCFDPFIGEADNTTAIRSESPCSYAAVMEKKAFTYSTTYMFGKEFSNAYQGKVLAVSDCVDYKSDVNGYRCNCSNGYRGNPYIEDGCIHIDECRESATLCSPGICNNTPGNFTCSCSGTKRMIDGVCVFWASPIVGASVGLVGLVVVMPCVYLTNERRKLKHIKQKYFRQHGGLLLFEEMKSQQGMSFRIFSEEELKHATNGFDEQHVLGHGSHGTVYKGFLKGDFEIAVKKCMTINEQQRKEFGKETMILSQINHRNIVKLLGCCLEVEVPILVYKFVANFTVFDFIHGHRHHIPLTTRLRITHESVEALAYLHSCASPPILHGDVKSFNILLDKDFTVKVFDFGASILAPTDESQFVTIVQGTCGYLDPEYMQKCQLTDKSDVYSFGVVLLELITGMKPFNLQGLEYEKSLSMRLLSVMKENKLEDMVDDEIKTNEDMVVLEEVAELAAQYLEMCGVNRPSMKEVADKLDRLRKVMQHPWTQQSLLEMESLLGETSSISSSFLVTTEISV